MILLFCWTDYPQSNANYVTTKCNDFFSVYSVQCFIRLATSSGPLNFKSRLRFPKEKKLFNLKVFHLHVHGNSFLREKGFKNKFYVTFACNRIRVCFNYFLLFFVQWIPISELGTRMYINIINNF